MLAIAIRFPGGRYHATPWGRHVNEADVAWPPDPWRLCRALIATWHRKGVSSGSAPDHLETLLTALAEELPFYRLPPVVHAHTRQYVPVRSGKKDKKTLIFDGFARIGPTDDLIMVWPGIELGAETTTLLDALLEGLGYLGRAESWVEARRLGGWAGEVNCVPCGQEDPYLSPEVQTEVVQMLAPRRPSEYSAFREPALATLATRGMRPAERKRVATTLPESWLAALGVETADLHAAGWNHPPAARLVSYLRPEGCLQPTALQATAPHGPSARSDTVRFALYGSPLPRIEDAVKVGEWARAAVMSLAKHQWGETRLPPIFSGHGCRNHQHAFYLPEDADHDGLVDHLTIHAPKGFTPEETAVLGRLTRLWTREGHDWKVVFEREGSSSQFAKSTELCAATRKWSSFTPYLHPWHRKKKFGVEEQLRRECRDRGLPELIACQPVAAVHIRSRERKPVHFRRFRSKRGLVQPDTRGGFWQLTFSDPVQGPLALGFGCHFGLGLFVPSVYTTYGSAT